MEVQYRPLALSLVQSPQAEPNYLIVHLLSFPVTVQTTALSGAEQSTVLCLTRFLPQWAANKADEQNLQDIIDTIRINKMMAATTVTGIDIWRFCVYHAYQDGC
jgi:hypothetical protein